MTKVTDKVDKENITADTHANGYLPEDTTVASGHSSWSLAPSASYRYGAKSNRGKPSGFPGIWKKKKDDSLVEEQFAK